jgi:hypothetical protein
MSSMNGNRTRRRPRSPATGTRHPSTWPRYLKRQRPGHRRRPRRRRHPALPAALPRAPGTRPRPPGPPPLYERVRAGDAAGADARTTATRRSPPRRGEDQTGRRRHLPDPPRRDPGLLHRVGPDPARHLAGPHLRAHLAKRVSHGRDAGPPPCRHQPGPRDRQNIHRGLVDGLAMFEKDVKVVEPEPMDEFRNFGVATPDGIRDVTGAFRQYYSTARGVRADRVGRPPDVAGGDRPLLAHPAGRGRSHPALAHDPDVPLRTTGHVRSPVLDRASSGWRRSTPGARMADRHPLRPDPRLRHRRPRLRPRRAVQHRARPGEAASRGARRRSSPTATGSRRSTSPTSRRCPPGSHDGDWVPDRSARG